MAVERHRAWSRPFLVSPYPKPRTIALSNSTVADGQSLNWAATQPLPFDSLTGFMTAGCQLGPDGTPWYEFGSRNGDVGYADSTYLRFSYPACLQGTVEVRRSAEAPVEATWEGPIEGHAYDDGGPLMAFIPNSDIGSNNRYRLVPSEAVTFSPPQERPCS